MARANYPVEDGLAIFRTGRHLISIPEDQLELETPCVILLDPKYPHNVGQAVRIASCYGVRNILMSGNRVDISSATKHFRLPREERMRGYEEVRLIRVADPIRLIPEESTPICVEFRNGSECLSTFDHPEDAVYIFGPEDGSVPGSVLKHCHRFVIIPTRHCLNLATAVGTVLYDRVSKVKRCLSAQ